MLHLRSLPFAAFFVLCLAISAAHARKPNIVYILADDLGYGELGCYGQQYIRTPHIDSLATDGIRFTQHYCGAPVCAPTRCVLMTGKHLGHAYIRNNGEAPERRAMRSEAQGIFPGQNPIPDEEVTIAELLKTQGYATAAIGKWGLGYEGSTGDPNRQGFDLFYGFLCQWHAHNHYPRFLWRNGVKETLPGNDRTLNGATYSQDKFTENALAFIRDNRERPFFLYLPFAIPHLSIQAPAESLAWYQGKIPEADYKHRGYLKHPYPRAGYAAMVTHMDRDVGKILSLLAELGLEEDTLVMFSSDNGPTYDRLGGSDSEFFHSAGPFRGFKGSVYDGGIRAPLVARWKGKIEPGRSSDLISAQWDMLPTFGEIAGAQPPADIDGISLLPTLLGKSEQAHHEYLYWEFPAYGGQQAIRLGNWKGVRQNMIAKKNRHLELYNLADDIGETRDVSTEHPEIVAQLEQLMTAAHSPAAIKTWNFVDN
ncbi:MAG: arylsulfatase [Planctomycetales bacterium]|nr:arylsulfatase [Planctomycetales bacterium]